jgi:hypothetical protein
MYCSRHDSLCREDCPMYIPSMDSCLEAIKIKSDLGILSQDEKQGLTNIRTGKLPSKAY